MLHRWAFTFLFLFMCFLAWQNRQLILPCFLYSDFYAILYMKFTGSFAALFFRGQFRFGLIGEIFLVNRISAAGGSTPPVKSFLTILIATEIFLWYSYFRFFFSKLMQLATTIVILYIINPA